MRLLIADDDAVARRVVAASLACWPFDVTAVENGTRAWEVLSVDEGPTLAILDWMMPGTRGPDVCRRVREERPDANVYLMLLTSLESRRDQVAGLEAGADDYLVKPFDPSELVARVRNAVRLLTLQERLTAKVEELEQALASEKRLQGLLPICSYCKRVRGDDQYWQAVEAYVSEHSCARFSHGICPNCLEKVREEFIGWARLKPGTT